MSRCEYAHCSGFKNSLCHVILTILFNAELQEKIVQHLKINRFEVNTLQISVTFILLAHVFNANKLTKRS